MKKIAPLAAALLLTFAFTSCKKNYTCTCTVTSNGVSATGTSSSFKDTKKNAKAACEKNNSTQTVNGVTITTSCSI